MVDRVTFRVVQSEVLNNALLGHLENVGDKMI